MIEQKLYLKNGFLFANGFERVVHGGRGDYIELTRAQIKLPLLSRFGNKNWETTNSEDIYYYWLFPVWHPYIILHLQQIELQQA